MEKRMGRRLKPCLAGLLIIFGITSFSVSAQEGGGWPDQNALIIETSGIPDNPSAGGNWTLTIMVDHPVTHEVLVRPPRFPESFILERVRTESRLLRQAGDAAALTESSRWTAVEFLFTVQSAGSFTIAPFAVEAGTKQAVTDAIAIRVTPAPAAAGPALPFMRWDNTPSVLTVGIQAELTLALHNWDRSKPLPGSLLQGRVPEKFILEESAPVDAGVIRYQLRIIPLEAVDFDLGPLSVIGEGIIIQIPRITIPVTGNPDRTGSSTAHNTAYSGTEAVGTEKFAVEANTEIFIPFPDTEKKVFILYRPFYEGIVIQARSLWEEGFRAEALALVRRNERDSVLGPSFMAIRSAMERSAGLEITNNEKWRFTGIIAWAVLLLIIITVTFCFVKGFKYGGNQKSKAIIALFSSQRLIGMAAAVLILLLLASLYTILMAPAAASAVLKESSAFRVPDINGTLLYVFDEGQPVKITTEAASWFFVETADNRSGWVPAEAVIAY